MQTVCLPRENDGDLVTAGTNGFVAGWGATSASTPEDAVKITVDEYSKVLRHDAFEIRSDSLCEDAARLPPLKYNSTMTFCAGDGKGKSDACKGDSGGAFVRHVRTRDVKRWVAIGVVSWGRGCAQKDEYGYYTRVYPFIGWIKKTISGYCV